MSLEPTAVVYSTNNTGLPANKVMSVCDLLFNQDCTIPFIARYRKEVTGNMDEVQIRDIQKFYEEHIEIEKRRAYILEQIKKMEQLTPALEKQILAATSLTILEDIYAPYKSKKKTKATIAKEKGLEPLSELILKSNKSLDEQRSEIEKDFVKDAVKTFDEAVVGACDILVEKFTHDLEIKETLRTHFWKDGQVVTSKRKDADTIKDSHKFKDFFEFTESVDQIKNPKNTHRYLAMRRAMTLKILKVEVTGDSEFAYGLIQSSHFPDGDSLGNIELLQKVAKKAYDSNISSSLDLEVKGELKKIADEAAINVFGVNLKNLLLQPYLGSKAVLGIDPGIRTGCKVVIIDSTGKFMGDHVIYPFEPKMDVKGSKLILEKMIEAFNIEYIAIGNGTNGRESLDFVEKHIDQVKAGKVKATMISESGASIYSASDIARKEFPDKDVTVRGAISIARRFQDPLAELVKLDPKSIGVGQYQHDVNQIKLKKQLAGVVESCVNFVGVDLNTASAPLLSYISGIGPSVAENVVKFREKKGGLKSRQELLKVPRFSQKIFEQSAGFLRIYQGENPLDSTFIHPEKYDVIEKWSKGQGIKLSELFEQPELIEKLKNDSNLRSKIGDLTFEDIIKSIQAPSQDPRSTFKSVEFDRSLKTITDVKLGSWYTGIVTNITNFGAFVDFGVKENGLLHISQISDEFVENALDKLTVGEELKVKVLSIDMDRKRIALSCKSDSEVDYSSNTAQKGQNSTNNRPKNQKSRPQPASNIKNNAFAGLKNLKL